MNHFQSNNKGIEDKNTEKLKIQSPQDSNNLFEEADFDEAATRDRLLEECIRVLESNVASLRCQNLDLRATVRSRLRERRKLQRMVSQATERILDRNLALRKRIRQHQRESVERSMSPLLCTDERGQESILPAAFSSTSDELASAAATDPSDVFLHLSYPILGEGERVTRRVGLYGTPRAM